MFSYHSRQSGGSRCLVTHGRQTLLCCSADKSQLSSLCMSVGRSELQAIDCCRPIHSALDTRFTWSVSPPQSNLPFTTINTCIYCLCPQKHKVQVHTTTRQKIGISHLFESVIILQYPETWRRCERGLS